MSRFIIAILEKKWLVKTLWLYILKLP